MKEKPIIFKAEMVRAILEGRKTQTRRVVKLDGFEGDPVYETENGLHNIIDLCPYKVGQTLWVRETFQISKGDFAPTLEEELTKKPNILYYASDNPRYRDNDKWTPSIHMPRLASRIDLEVTNVRVERVQEISEEDAIAEGVLSISDPSGKSIWGDGFAKACFRKLWDSINVKKGHGWNENPWVWVIEFKRKEK